MAAAIYEGYSTKGSNREISSSVLAVYHHELPSSDTAWLQCEEPAFQIR